VVSSVARHRLTSVKLSLLSPIALLFLVHSAFGEQQTPNGRYTATAYAQSGETASGILTKRHIVAADPDYLPIGSRIKVRHAGRYSGEYVVADTGEKILGRRLDIFIPSPAACRKFGRKNVKVTVVTLGDNTHATTKKAEAAVTKDVKQDLQQKVVGNAATQDDWTARKSVGSQADTPHEAQGQATAPPGAPSPSSQGAGVEAK
jgi:3D (Asp-Asp-Asp) domain-containing protein